MDLNNDFIQTEQPPNPSFDALTLDNPLPSAPAFIGQVSSLLFTPFFGYVSALLAIFIVSLVLKSFRGK